MTAPLALLTPMANPTVEREMRRLLPLACDYLVGRLVGTEANSEQRLREYAEKLDRALEQFGGHPLAGIAFACTASSYLIGRNREDAITDAISLPLLWAAGCIRDQLHARGAARIAVISPYPEPIHRAGLAYWEAAGFRVVDQHRIEIGSADTRAIYALAGSEARALIDQARAHAPDAILLSGTGMPTLALLDPDAAVPVLSSNYCLAQAMRAFQDTRP